MSPYQTLNIYLSLVIKIVSDLGIDEQKRLDSRADSGEIEIYIGLRWNFKTLWKKGNL